MSFTSLSNKMDEYYHNQAGSGIGGFSGLRYQKGNGFFGRLISGTVLPLLRKVLPYLGRTAMETGMDIAKDLSEGKKFKESFKERAKASGKKISEAALAKAEKMMSGSGIRRRRRRVLKASARPTKRRRAASKVIKRRRTKRRSRGRKTLATTFF